MCDRMGLDGGRSRVLSPMQGEAFGQGSSGGNRISMTLVSSGGSTSGALASIPMMTGRPWPLTHAAKAVGNAGLRFFMRVAGGTWALINVVLW